MANEPKHQGALQHGVAEIDPWPNTDKFATLICKTSKMVLHQNGYEYELWSKILFYLAVFGINNGWHPAKMGVFKVQMPVSKKTKHSRIQSLRVSQKPSFWEAHHTNPQFPSVSNIWNLTKKNVFLVRRSGDKIRKTPQCRATGCPTNSRMFCGDTCRISYSFKMPVMADTNLKRGIVMFGS